MTVSVSSHRVGPGTVASRASQRRIITYASVLSEKRDLWEFHPEEHTSKSNAKRLRVSVDRGTKSGTKRVTWGEKPTKPGGKPTKPGGKSTKPGNTPTRPTFDAKQIVTDFTPNQFKQISKHVKEVNSCIHSAAEAKGGATTEDAASDADSDVPTPKAKRTKRIPKEREPPPQKKEEISAITKAKGSVGGKQLHLDSAQTAHDPDRPKAGVAGLKFGGR